MSWQSGGGPVDFVCTFGIYAKIRKKGGEKINIKRNVKINQNDIIPKM